MLIYFVTGKQGIDHDQDLEIGATTVAEDLVRVLGPGIDGI